MLKAYREALKSLFPISIHITCMAHIMNLIGGAFCKPFTELNTFMMCISQMFYMAGSCKRRYLSYLSGKPTMAPNPCDTRWNSRFSAVKYHTEHFTFYREFLQADMQVGLTLTPSPASFSGVWVQCSSFSGKSEQNA